MAIPTHSPYVIIGAGIHGLSTAYHLALQLKATGKGDGHGHHHFGQVRDLRRSNWHRLWRHSQ